MAVLFGHPGSSGVTGFSNIHFATSVGMPVCARHIMCITTRLWKLLIHSPKETRLQAFSKNKVDLPSCSSIILLQY
jgi:hypothetical protein